MTFLKNIFGVSDSNNAKIKVNWINLYDINQLDELIALSAEKKVVIFKHSTTCGISKMVLKEFENQYDTTIDMLPYYLDLKTYRGISNEIAHRFGVEHQSPQLLLIDNGKCIYNASHENIDANVLKKIV